jgi:hypothetical protein
MSCCIEAVSLLIDTVAIGAVSELLYLLATAVLVKKHRRGALVYTRLVISREFVANR